MMPPSVLELVALGLPLVVQGNQDARIQERQLPQPLRERVEAELDGLKNLRVRTECDPRAALPGRACDFEVGSGLAAFVLLLVHLAVAPDFQVELLGQRVDDRDTDAVQTTGDFIAVVVELAPGMQHRQHDFGRRPSAGVLIGGDAAPVVDDGD